MFVKIAKQLAAEIDPPDPVGQFLKTNILPISLVETMIQFSEPHRIAPFLKIRRTNNSWGYSQETTAGEYSLSDRLHNPIQVGEKDDLIPRECR
jgi:hypothetical protein